MNSILLCNPYILYVSCLKKLIPVEVDRFLCCGEWYRTVRDGVGQVLLDSNTDALKATLQVSIQKKAVSKSWNTVHFISFVKSRQIYFIVITSICACCIQDTMPPGTLC